MSFSHFSTTFSAISSASLSHPPSLSNSSFLLLKTFSVYISLIVLAYVNMGGEFLDLWNLPEVIPLKKMTTIFQKWLIVNSLLGSSWALLACSGSMMKQWWAESCSSLVTVDAGTWWVQRPWPILRTASLHFFPSSSYLWSFPSFEIFSGHWNGWYRYPT